MNIKSLSEKDICTKYINPSIKRAGWDMHRQVREEVSFTDGRIIVQGKIHTRGKRKRADFILNIKPNIPISIIEAKPNKKAKGAEVMDKILDEDEGIIPIEKPAILKVSPLKELGKPLEIVKLFGNKKDYENAVQELENEIYKTSD